MSFSFSNVEHALASGFMYIVKGAQSTAKFIADKVEGTEGTVESLSALIPGYGDEAVAIERAAYSGLGVVTSLLGGASKLGDDGAKAAEKLFLDAGLDKQLIQDFKDLYSNSKTQLAAVGVSVGTAAKAAAPAPAKAPAPANPNPTLTEAQRVAQADALAAQQNAANGNFVAK